MKTIVVLSTLVAVAISAPTLFDNGSEAFKKTLTKSPATTKWIKRSPLQEVGLDSNPASGTHTSLLTSNPIEEHIPLARTIIVKKPIIIKQKQGYHTVYRNSDEELVDSDETCGKQVKVKLCDVKSNMKSVELNSHLTEDEMKHSIKLAKEAVENLQRDFQKIENKPHSDVELHHDIETAREALDHIHKNFGHLESMSLHGPSKTEKEIQAHTQSEMTHLEEERLAQWKDAVDAIHKNTEVAKNIEDSLKVTELSEDSSMLSLDGSTPQDMRATENVPNNEETPSESMPKACNLQAKETTLDTEEDDMKTAASTMSEQSVSKVEVPMKENPEMQSQGSFEEMKTEKEKSAEVETTLTEELTPTDDLKERESNFDQENANTEFTDSEAASSMNKMKSSSINEETMELSKEHAVDKSLKTDENEEKMITEAASNNMKTAENFENKNFEENLQDKPQQISEEETEASMFVKSADTSLFNLQVPIDALSKRIEKVHKAITEPLLQIPTSKNAETEFVKPQDFHKSEKVNSEAHSHLHPEMKATEEGHNFDVQEPWQNKALNWQEESMRAAEHMHHHGLEHMEHMHDMEPHHHHSEGMMNHHFQTPIHHPVHHHGRFADKFSAQGKSADMNMQNYYMMRDGSEQQFRWRPMHEGPRSAYGAPAAPVAAPPSGAIGLFPNANVGNCAIPLLLSCNPSVVSGSLSKPHPAPYAAPSYRTEEDFSFHSKRDVKKPHDNYPTMKKNQIPLKNNNLMNTKQ